MQLEGRRMEEKTRLRELAEQYRKELEKAAKETEKGVIRALDVAEDLGKRVCSIAERETKVAGAETKKLTVDVLNGIKKELPGIRKDFEKMEHRIRKQIEDLERALDKLL